MNSYAIFQDFLSNPIIISAKVNKSPTRSLEFPSILMCNEQAFKNPDMVTDYEGYKNNTIDLDEFLLFINLIKNSVGANMETNKQAMEKLFDVKLKPIKENVQEVLTAFHGICFLIQEKQKVRSICQLYVIALHINIVCLSFHLIVTIQLTKHFLDWS